MRVRVLPWMWPPLTAAERELRLIAPKGRPVKQCDHCRGARNSKSSHTKCDCGTKRERKEHSPVKGAPARPAESACSCADGDDCHCGRKSETVESRMARSLARPAPPVKSKSTLSVAETKMTHFANGHHKPVHRNNLSAHVSGAPYCKPRRSQRPQSAHVDPVDTSMDEYGMDLLSRSADDVTFSRLSALMPQMSMDAATSDAALVSDGPPTDYVDFDKHFFRNGDARFDQPGSGSGYASTRGSPTPQQAFPLAAASVTSPNFDAGEDMYPMHDYFATSSDAAGIALVTAALQQPGLTHSDSSAPLTGSPVSMTDEVWAAARAEFAAPSRQQSDIWDGSLGRSTADIKSWMMLPTSTSSTYPGDGPQQLGGIYDSTTAANILGVPALAAQRQQQLPQSPLPFRHATRLMTPPAAVVDSPPHGYVLMRRAGAGGTGTRGSSAVASGATSACASNLDEDEAWGDARVAGLDAPVAAPVATGGDGSMWNTYSWLIDDDTLARR
jgi:hypothetical protein